MQLNTTLIQFLSVSWKMLTFLKCLSKWGTIVIKKTFVALFSIIIYIVVPPFFLLLTPIYIFRLLVSKSAPLLRSDLGKMLSTRSSLVASDDIYGKPNINLIVVLEIDGPLDMEDTRIEVAKTVFAKDEKGRWIRPELQQFLTSWMGFYFWKNCPDFNLNEHVFFYEGQGWQGVDGIVYDKHLVEIAKGILAKPHRRGKPLWEMIVVRNYCSCDDPDILKSVIIYRVHHALADGFSLVKLLLHVIGKKATIPYRERDKPNSKLKRILNKIGFALRIPLEFMPIFLTSFDMNEWRYPEWKMTKDVRAGMSPRVSMNMLKEVKAIHGVSVTAIIIAAITGAIRNFMILKGVKVPKNMHAGIPLPVPDHPDQLRNHMTICMIPLPVGLSNPLDRLKTLHNCLEKMKSSTIPTIAFAVMPLLGGLFPCISKLLFRNFVTTCLMTSFPGPKEPIGFLGYPISNIAVGSGLLPGSTAVGFTTLSYKGFIKIVAGADAKIIGTDAEAQEVITLALREFEIFLESAKQSS